tara:strand:- start:653 stop:784 length:132 start_codon:yes stop_codon:yes gene_type:complete
MYSYNYSEVWAQLWEIKVKWREGDIDGDDAMYQIETLMDEVGE